MSPFASPREMHSSRTTHAHVVRPFLVLIGAWFPLVAGAQGTPASSGSATSTAQPRLGTRDVPVIEQGGLRFRDLNRNGVLDPYED